MSKYIKWISRGFPMCIHMWTQVFIRLISNARDSFDSTGSRVNKHTETTQTGTTSIEKY